LRAQHQSVETALGALQPLGRVIGIAADVTQPDQVSAFFAAVDGEFGGLTSW